MMKRAMRMAGLPAIEWGHCQSKRECPIHCQAFRQSIDGFQNRPLSCILGSCRHACHQKLKVTAELLTAYWRVLQMLQRLWRADAVCIASYTRVLTTHTTVWSPRALHA